MDTMTQKKNSELEISNEIKAKIGRREKKRRPKMKISGKRVFQLKNLLKK